jgi:hypothetical protein
MCRIASFAVARIGDGSLAGAALELGFEGDLCACHYDGAIMAIHAIRKLLSFQGLILTDELPLFR